MHIVLAIGTESHEVSLVGSCRIEIGVAADAQSVTLSAGRLESR